MALQKQIIKNIYGRELMFNNAYIQITNITGNKESIEMRVTTFDSCNKENALGFSNYSFIPNSDDNYNFLEQGYKHLKTLTEFENAIDVLED